MPAPATQVGPYRLLRRLGAGGMGEVWLAEHAQLGVQRAVKLISQRVDVETLLRFQREAQAMAALNHPNVARIHERGDHQGRPYLVLDLLPGGDLADRLREGPLGLAEADAILAGLAAGLEHMHEQGVLHRDIKPANVLFDEHGQPQWVDFGLARMAGAGSLTESGTIMGTPGYMAPEQALGELGQLDARTDVYGLGALLYHCLAGQPPFAGQSLPTLLHQVVNAQPAPPSAHRPGLPAAVDAVCLRALAKRGADRFASPTELAAAFSAATRGDPARPSPIPRWVLAVAVLVVVALAGVSAAYRRRPGRPSPTGPESGAASATSAPSSRPPPAPESPPAHPPSATPSRIDLTGETQSLVAFSPDGALRIVTSQGRMLVSLPVGAPPKLVTYATARPLSRDFWHGRALAISGSTIGPVRWTDTVSERLVRKSLDSLAVDPSGRVAVLGLAQVGCQRLGLEDPFARPEPWLDPPTEAHRPKASIWLGQDFLVAWNKPEDLAGPDETRLILYDPSGRQLDVRKVSWRVRSFTNPEPDVVLAGDRSGLLYVIAWDEEALSFQPWNGARLSEQMSIARHMPASVEGLAVAGPAASRTLYAISRPRGGERMQGMHLLRAWSWETTEVVGSKVLDCVPLNIAISPRGDWLAIGTDQEQVLVLRLADGAPAWE